jgi:hypothetical protein
MTGLKPATSLQLFSKNVESLSQRNYPLHDLQLITRNGCANTSLDENLEKLAEMMVGYKNMLGAAIWVL